MKTLLLTLLLVPMMSFGQAPEGFNYQAVVRNAGGIILNNQPVGMRLTVQQGSIGGTAVYTETFTSTTNGYGLVNLEIGTGTSTDDFSTIDWANGPYFMETAVDFLGGMTWVVMGTSQLMSVPYALYAKTSGNGEGPAGADGIDGVDGQDGIDGIDGAQGPQGLTGPAGDDGIDGQDGAQGIQGLTGATGQQGATGNNGDVGDAGLQGPIGPAGNDGQGGVTTAGTNVTITGTGTVASPYVVSTTSPCGLAIGQTYQGGIIFYLDASGCHGLISAPTNQSSSASWYNGNYIDTKAYGSGLFEGKYNTVMINDNQGGATSAAAICGNLSLGGYDDWYLPSIEELNKMYQNIGQGNTLGLGNVGGFDDFIYWSSTEYDLNVAWGQIFYNGGQLDGDKANGANVRSVRAF